MKTANLSRATAVNLPFNVNHRDWLISISCVNHGPPYITAPFGRIEFFKFDDVEADDTDFVPMTEQQAEEMAKVIFEAKEQGKNLWVHCYAGICRSGAVVEVLKLLGWYVDEEWVLQERIPNQHVFNLLRKACGLKHSFEN